MSIAKALGSSVVIAKAVGSSMLIARAVARTTHSTGNLN